MAFCWTKRGKASLSATLLIRTLHFCSVWSTPRLSERSLAKPRVLTPLKSVFESLSDLSPT